MIAVSATAPLWFVVNIDNKSSDTLGRMSQAAVELLLRGYHAFVAGDLATIADMLDPEVEWLGVGHVTLDRCIGIGDQVVVSMRFSRNEPDPTDERPLQSRRTYLVGRYAAIITT